MTQGEARALVKRAARNARAAYRKADSAGERLERELDRLLKRKTLIQACSLGSAEKSYYAYKNQVASLEKAMADFYNAASL